MSIGLKYFLLIEFFFLLVSETNAFAVCSSITLQGNLASNSERLNKIRNCSIIFGHLRILNAKLDFDHQSMNQSFSPQTYLFPHLVEITDYLLVFQVQNVPSLDVLFPRLSIIRGHNLFKNYALIVFLTNSLLKLNLIRLIHIESGSILFSRLYHTCYVNTIDWSYILKDASAANKPTITLINNECVSETCMANCKSTHGCWNENQCQLKCPKSCSNGCNLDNVVPTSTCCQNNSLCLHCNRNNDCISCLNLRNMISGHCVNECPANTLIYRAHSCIKLEDCSNAPTSLIKNHFVLNGTHCVRQCPFGYRVQINTSGEFKFSECVQCEDNICKRNCESQVFTLKTNKDLESIKNCYVIKRLHIELRYNVTELYLIENLKYLETIDEYLVIVRNRHLNSLSFLSSLRLIRGQVLFENKFALFVHTNEKLRDLWTLKDAADEHLEKKRKFTIERGTVKFFENPELCFKDIEIFMHQSNLNKVDAEISFNFNGYKRFTCSNRSIDLEFKIESKRIRVNWNVTISDLRRLKGYTLSYTKVPNNFEFDQNNVDFMHSYINYQTPMSYDDNDDVTTIQFEWNYVYLQYDEKSNKRQASVHIDVEPFTRYAIYLKADLTTNTDWTMQSGFDSDPLISRIRYVHTLPAQPSRIETITYEPLSFDQVKLMWSAPKRPNGIIDFFYIVYKPLKDLETFSNQTDNCQFVSIASHRFTDHFSIKSQTTTKLTVATKPTTHANETNAIKCLNEFGMKKPKKSYHLEEEEDFEKNDIISVEDEIYNLAFRPALKRILVNKSKTKFSSNVKISNSTRSIGQSANSTTSMQVDTKPKEKSNEFYVKFVQEHFDTNSNLLKIVGQDLLDQSDDLTRFNYLKVSDSTFETVISNLTSFARYIVSIVACQNYTNDLLKYSKSFHNTDNKEAFSSHVNFFPIENYCSKASLLTFRSLPDERRDQVVDVALFGEKDIYYFEWNKPANPNGYIYKYNLRFIDIKSNKTQGPVCHSSLVNLKVALNEFLLSEGHEYLIQVQAVSTAGPGSWSPPVIKYRVPFISRYYINLIVYISAGVTLFLIVLTVSLIFLRKYYKSKKNGYFSISSHYYYFRPDEWEIKRENVIIGERIGSGCFAEVHKGKVKLKDEEYIDCAIKFCGSDDQNRQRILKEANMMKFINTTHIVKLLGVVTKDNPAYLILEFMDRGDLKEYLRNLKSTSTELSTERLYRIAGEIADGMLWLSEHKYIHRDLAARNCLISKDDVIKIADLGLSKDIYQNPVYREKCKSLLPIRWMSPESLIDGSSTTKSDVWSYGVVIWEISTYGDNPYTGKDNEEVIQFVKKGGKLELPDTAPFKFHTIFNKCTTIEDFKRISFKEIVDILDPDLEAEFKQTSFYHNDFKRKLIKKKIDRASSIARSNTITTNITIADPQIDSDNYM